MEAAACAKAPLLKCRMPVTVIGRPLLRVTQGFVGFAELLESLFRRMIAGVLVGVKLHRKLAIGALDLFVAGVASNSEHFIVIAFPSHQAGGPFETTTLAGRMRRSLSLKPFRI